MNKENKCFFSISLENGITISGANPDEVKEFLMDFYTAAIDCANVSKIQHYPNFAKKMEEHAKDLLHATHTIISNQKKQ